jgi:hypothetical protein
MLWNLPLNVRLAILFVFLPLVDHIFRSMFGYYMTSGYTLRSLEKFNRLWYLYGWFLVFKSMLVMFSMYMSETISNYTYSAGADYRSFLLLMGYFLGGFLMTLVHVVYASKVTKAIAIIGLLGGFMLNVYCVHNRYLLYGSQYFADSYIWEPLLAVAIVYRFKIESVLRL